MKRILFVDDEPKVLQGLQRMLRPMRHEWEMAFSPSGQEALDALSKQPFDVLVTDMWMPGMDGAVLLTEVMRRYPEMVRIVLSGHASNRTVIRSVGTAHQYLLKPCDPDKLKRTVDRAFALHDQLSDDSLKQLLSRLKSVPSMPRLYAELMDELKCQDASVKRVGEIISKDPGMTAKVLQLVNSAFFGVPRHISSPSQAATMLGTDTLKALVLSVEVFSQLKDTECESVDFERLWKHSMETAAVAKQIAVADGVRREVANDATMAALLHDAGMLVLAQNLPEQHQEAVVRARDDSLPLCDAEHEVFGATHADVGAYLLGLWGLPDPIVEAVAFHHCPGKSYGDTFAPLTAVHVANVLIHEWHQEDTAGGVEELDLDYLTQLGLADRIPAWRDAAEKVLSEGDAG